MVSTRASSKRKRSSYTRDDQNAADLRQPKRRGHSTPTSLNKLQTVESHSRAVPPAQEKSTTFPRPPSSTFSHPIIFTVGHGTRTLSTLIDLLQSAHVTKLVDVRSIPRSYTNPQFNRDVLVTSNELKTANIEYIWCGVKLGGRRSARQPNVERHTAIRVAAFRNYAGYMSTQNFRDGLEELKALAEKPRSRGSQLVAIMCSETLWWRCHRRMIADALLVEGWDAQHLGVKKGEAMKHVLWEIARTDYGELIYDVKS
ncbi:HhH-GPD domain-containing protein [Halenospora varia]|nr:HhH-GPD domain-containing protein [Halenospora varia]